MNKEIVQEALAIMLFGANGPTASIFRTKVSHPNAKALGLRCKLVRRQNEDCVMSVSQAIPVPS